LNHPTHYETLEVGGLVSNTSGELASVREDLVNIT
jgi:hypothetical protein